jgi:hypothetical protein
VRTQVEPDHLGKRHPEMREAVRVDGDALNPSDLALAQGALDCGTSLPAVEDDRLIVEDTPLVEDMSVGVGARKQRRFLLGLAANDARLVLTLSATVLANGRSCLHWLPTSEAVRFTPARLRRGAAR